MDILALVSDPIVKLLKWHWLEQIGIPSILFRLFLAVLCGGAIGMERAKKHQAAGFKNIYYRMFGFCNSDDDK